MCGADGLIKRKRKLVDVLAGQGKVYIDVGGTSLCVYCFSSSVATECYNHIYEYIQN